MYATPGGDIIGDRMIDLPYQPVPTDRADDYSGRLIAAGVILLLIAAMCGCVLGLVPLILVSQARTAAYAAQSGRPRPITLPTHQLMATIALYGVGCVGAGWLGIGALMKRRWVRPLVLTFSVHGILLGVATAIMSVVSIPVMLENIQRRSGPVANSFAATAALVGMAIAFGVMIGLPVTLVLLMRHDGVRRTAERFDRKTRWTDALPLPVLGLVVTLAAVAVMTTAMFLRPVVPVGGLVVTGAGAIAIVVAYLALLVWAAREAYRKTVLGWWLAMAALVGPLVLMLPSAIWMPLDQYYAALDTAPELSDLMVEHAVGLRIAWAALLVIFAVASAWYVARLRPHFATDERSTAA